MSIKNASSLRLIAAGSCSYIDVVAGHGEALSRFLRSRGVTCSPPQPSSDGVDSIEVARGVDTKFVQKLLDGWKA